MYNVMDTQFGMCQNDRLFIVIQELLVIWILNTICCTINLCTSPEAW